MGNPGIQAKKPLKKFEADFIFPRPYQVPAKDSTGEDNAGEWLIDTTGVIFTGEVNTITTTNVWIWPPLPAPLGGSIGPGFQFQWYQARPRTF